VFVMLRHKVYIYMDLMWLYVSRSSFSARFSFLIYIFVKKKHDYSLPSKREKSKINTLLFFNSYGEMSQIYIVG